jgi:tetratricopeptide (TPR) repeat protein
MQANSPDDYPAAFRRLLGRAVTLVMEESAQPGWRFDPESQAQLLFSLANALRLPAVWPVTLPLLAVLAPRLEQAGLRAEWLTYLDRGIACCDISGDKQTAADLAFARGVLLERLGRLPEAHAGLADAIECYAAIGDVRNKAKAHNRLAYTLRRAQPIESQRHVDQAIRLLDPHDPELLYCHLVLGTLACDARNWSEAEQHFQLCVDGWRSGHDRRLYGMALINMSTVHSLTGRYQEAIECLQAAVSIVSEAGDIANEALVHLNLGTAYLFRGNPEASIPESLAAEAIYRRLQDEQRLAIIYSNLGIAYGEIKQWPKAEQNFLAAIQRFTALEDYPNLVDTLIDLAQIYLRSEQAEQARACAVKAGEYLPAIAHARARDYQAAKLEGILAAASAL